MSFAFQWPRFSEQFHADAIQMLNNALNKGDKPPVIADKIEVVELEMGTQPPELEIRDIGELTMDQFRGIFRLTYNGDAYIVLKTKVQANPLNHKQPDIHLMTGSRGMLAAKEPLVVPMLLRLSHFRLNSYVVLVVSKQKGITLVFKTDPLQNVDINSTFDSIAVIQKFIQGEIEGQLRQMFREDLPGIIHRLSQQWVKTKVEAPYLDKRSPPPRRRPFDTVSAPDLTYPFPTVAIGLHKPFPHPLSLYGRSRSISGISNTSLPRKTPHNGKPSPPEPVDPTAVAAPFPDLENFDPTYGLRPMGVLSNTVFTSFGRLFKQNKGLADLAEEPSGEEQTERESFGVMDWEDSPPDDSPPPSISEDAESVTEYETVPAVGGGIVTRPRVYHSQSMVHPPVEASGSLSTFSHATSSTHAHRRRTAPPHWIPLPTTPLPFPHATSGLSSTSRSISNYGTDLEDVPYGYESRQRTLSVPISDFTQPISYVKLPLSPGTCNCSRSSSERSQSIETPPSAESPPPHTPSLPVKSSHRRLSVSSSSGFDVFHSGSPTHHDLSEADPRIVLRPALNNTVHQLSTLSHSNHTLSPYTPSLEHFTVRSVPPRPINTSGVQATPDRRSTKARRKRMYRIGGLKPEPPPSAPPPSSSPVPPSEFEQADMDQYFRFRDDAAIDRQRQPPSLPDRHDHELRYRRFHRS